MKLLAAFAILLINTVCIAQFAIITDPDGYAHVRETPEKGDNIIDELSNGELVFRLDTAGNWVMIDYGDESEIKYGYIYHDRLKFISDYESIPLKTLSKNSIQLANKEIKITLKQRAFDEAKHTYAYDEEYSNVIIHIDNRNFMGTDGEMPTTEYQSVQIEMGKNNVIALPPAAFEYLYQPNLENTKAYYNHEADILYITSMNSDGAGGYQVVWEIVNKVYKGRWFMHGF